MKTSQRGIDLIKSFEGFSKNAIKLSGERYYTIGYGHYGADVKMNQKITIEEAEKLLAEDLKYFESLVNTLPYPEMNQNQFDCLVSFTYNCGKQNLIKLTKNRPLSEVPQHILYYTNSSSEIYRAGLLRRRKAELALFLEPIKEEKKEEPKMKETKVIVGNKEVKGYLIDNTTYVPIRDIISALEFEVVWSKEKGAEVRLKNN